MVPSPQAQPMIGPPEAPSPVYQGLQIGGGLALPGQAPPPQVVTARPGDVVLAPQPGSALGARIQATGAGDAGIAPPQPPQPGKAPGNPQAPLYRPPSVQGAPGGGAPLLAVPRPTGGGGSLPPDLISKDYAEQERLTREGADNRANGELGKAGLIEQRAAQRQGFADVNRLRQDIRADARLAFERLYVSALVRHEHDDGMAQANRRVTGTDRARLALRAGEPLTRTNFLKGQSINGPTGVMARLARQIGLVDEDGLLGSRSLDLLVAWSTDEGLPGVLDEKRGDGGEGSRVIARFVDATSEALDGGWPGKQAGIWSELVRRLRPDQVGKEERKTCRRLLWKDATGVRGRVLDLLGESRETWLEQRNERAVLRGMNRLLGDAREDCVIAAVLDGIEAFEQASATLQGVFDATRWYLSSSGAASLKAVLGDTRVAKALERNRKRVPAVVGTIEASLLSLAQELSLAPALVEPLRQVRDDLSRATFTPEAIVEAVLDRHDRVQRGKRKGRWIERTERLTLMPGFGLEGDAPPDYHGLYLHPLRVANAYSLLADLGVVRGGADVDTPGD